ncbi:bifunctional 2-C-methyl-D-erythritol 4-phosphate cytidylyltransferase/2-C-methyl-D-erythritol 2,4-cyclodiphosphate synthase [Robiginitomaculum antarcticum]|uniref:bifunctional 2-C-methyl-D-erythritol 4-phosphate cytidylyltransferase/2-C-methyl-D-erythritol 2,4-cyclodiphosphate synthase n=1 Tax=Robiginitomaculum antarcticum TaxID=437507 RepID=UPI0003623FAB|nr:bifunctional 2-C-methyl-D-erythritol 4-phosphate cytidylyltransferase/2-C-methyl-D-erythritol 2,4-cyclodiphosphate synthase [Robiginitomaculum antarcticum]
MADTALILVAAGRGTRAQQDVPKQYRVIAGKTVLQHTLESCAKALVFNKIIFVISENDELVSDVITRSSIDIRCTTGGASRTDSVRAGLQALREYDIEHVFIHDAARPFVSSGLLQQLSEALDTHDAAAPALPVTDALKTKSGEAFDRTTVLRMQTPQAFHYDKIMAAFDALPAGHQAADDIAIAKTHGLSLKFVEGEERNFKITYPGDFERAEHMLQTDNYMAVGQGFDVHQFEAGGTMMLCGIAIDCGYRLKGHSDADAGLHALTDAIFGALGLGDIGDHFPPTDDAHKDQDSAEFLSYAIDKISERGAELQHVDLTLICEQPKIKPHRAAMRGRIAQLCALPLERVSIKATTTEALGFTGRKEGLAAQAIATLKIPQ